MLPHVQGSVQWPSHDTHCPGTSQTSPGTSVLAMGNDGTDTSLLIQQGTILRNKLALDGKYKKYHYEEGSI